jgi:hypothetical protein
MKDFIESSGLGVKSTSKKKNTTTYKTETGTITATYHKGKVIKLQVNKHQVMVGGLDEHEIIQAIEQSLGMGKDKKENITMSAKDLKTLMHLDKKQVDDLLQREKDLTKGSGVFVLWNSDKQKFLSEKLGLTKDKLKIKIYENKKDAFDEANKDEMKFSVVEI